MGSAAKPDHLEKGKKMNSRKIKQEKKSKYPVYLKYIEHVTLEHVLRSICGENNSS